MPSPLLTFDLFIVKERPLPLVCLGVYRHHSRRGRENQRYRLHLVDLNTCAPFSPTSDVHASPGSLAFAIDQPCDIKSCKVNGDQGSNQIVNDRSAGNDSRKLKQKLEYENRNNVFLRKSYLDGFGDFYRHCLLSSSLSNFLLSKWSAVMSVKHMALHWLLVQTDSVTTPKFEIHIWVKIWWT